MDRSVSRLMLILTVLCAAALVAAPGCSRAPVPSFLGGKAFLELGEDIQSSSARCVGTRCAYGDRVENGRLLTNTVGDLSGKLPHAQPVQLVTHGNQALNRVAITIDDGWNPDMRILELLNSRGIPFTAFLIGGRGVVDAHPEFVQAIGDAGGEVCNHTYSHFVMPGKDQKFVVDEIWKAQNAITGITHEILPYVRFSGGAYDQASLDWAAQQGFWVVNWTIASSDTDPGVTVDYQVNHILNNLQPGAILLFHFSGHGTYDVLAQVIPEIQKRGYEVTSLSRVMEGTPFHLE